MSHKRQGFTLIELLVVITIIVVLLALLVPALDKALYQAELAVCGANLKAWAGGGSVYAFDHKRRYPDRPYVQEGGAGRANFMRVAFSDQGRTYDLRQRLDPYISQKSWLDPLCEEVDFDDVQDMSSIEIPYFFFFGWQFPSSTDPARGNPRGGAGMFRVGDRWSWDRNRYNIIASDRDHFGDVGVMFNSHPDSDGVLVPEVLQNVDWIQVGFVGSGTGTWTTTRYRGESTLRGPVDENYAYDDGSVVGVRQIPSLRGFPEAGDPPSTIDHTTTMMPIPHYNNGPNVGFGNEWMYVPAR